MMLHLGLLCKSTYGHADAAGLLVNTVDPELLEDGVAGNHVGHGGGKGESSDRLHLDGDFGLVVFCEKKVVSGR